MGKPVPKDDLPSNVVPEDDLPGAPENIAPPKMFTPSGEKNLSFSNPELLAGHPITRAVKGVASAGLGVMQGADELAAWLASKIPGAAPKGKTVMSPILNQSDQMTQAGRRELGSEGFDWTEFGGAVMSPLPIKGGQHIAQAPKLIGKMARAVPVGAATAASMPVVGEGDQDNFAGEKLKQALAGGAIAGAIPPVGAALGKAGSVIKNASDLVLPGGPNNIANRWIKEQFGDAASQKLVAALDAARNKVPRSQPTAADAVAHLPEGSPMIAIQNLVAAKPGGPSIKMGERFSEQQAARRAVLQDLATRGTPLQQIVGRALQETLNPLVRNPHKRLDIVGRESPEKFLRAIVQNDQFVKNATKGWQGQKHGLAKPLDQVFNKTQMKALLGLVDEINTVTKVKHPIQRTATDLNVSKETNTQLPPLLNRAMTITNALLKAGAGRMEQKVTDNVADKLLNTAEMARVFRDVPPSEREKLLKAIINSGNAAVAGSTAAGLQEGR